MISLKQHFLILFGALSLFIVLLLTLSNSNYACHVKVNGVDETCAANGIVGDRHVICQGTVFVISAQTSSTNVLILCPWGPATVGLTSFGTVAALIYTALRIVQTCKPISSKFMMLMGFSLLPFLLSSTILMITGISDGGKKCQEFESDLRSQGSEGHCSNAAYGFGFILSIAGLLIFGYESIRGYYHYKCKIDDISKQEEDYKDVDTLSQTTADKESKTFKRNYDPLE